MQRTILLGVGVLGLLISTVTAQVPQIINYQGRVVLNATNTNFTGTGQFKFALVNSNGSVTYWSNDGTSSAGSQPTNAVFLSVANGLYSVVLGDIGYSNMTVIAASVFNNNDVRLRVWFNDGTAGSQLLTPDQRIASVGYSMLAATVADAAITSAKIAPGAVGAIQLANGGVGTAQLADGGISTAKIANNAVTSAQLGLGAVTTPNLALGSIGAAQIGDGTITAAKIGGGQLVKNVNGLTDGLTLAAGTNISITPSGNTLTLATSPVTWRLNGANTYFINGNVGIGINNPSSSLHINTTDDALRLTATQPYITFEDSGSGTYSRIQGNAAGLDLKAQGAVTGTLPGAFIHLDGTGRVGIGNTIPKHQLSIKYFVGGPIWTSNGWIGAIDLDNASAIGWAANSAGQRFGMGHSNGSFVMWRTLADPGTTASPAIYDFTITDAGKIGMGTLAPQANLHVFDANAASERIQSNGGTNAWSRMEFVTANGQWNVGTSRAYFGDAFYVARDPSPPVFYVQPNGDAYVQGIMSCGALTIRGGADLAEPFQMKEEVLEKGSVVVIDGEHPGRLKRSTHAYDRRVAGIISGANGINPGIALHQEGAIEGGQNVALTGRVYVQADASGSSIEPGDLLTTSDTPGFAMKVTDHARAQGAVIGKAMSQLKEGHGNVLVLVTLQ